MTTKNTNTEINDLWQILISGKIDVAVQGFQKIMQERPEDRAGWVGITAGFCAVGKIDNALLVISQRHETFHDGHLCVLEVMAGFASLNQLKLLEYLKENWQKDRADYVFCLYFYAQLLLELHQVDLAHPLFLQCKDLFNANEAALLVERDVNLFSLFRQCINLVAIENLDDLASGDNEDASAYVGDIKWLDDDKIEMPAIGFVAADRYYAETFGPEFLVSLSEYWPNGYSFHLHIIDVPRADQEALVANLKSHAKTLDLKISLSYRPEGFKIHKSAYYASMRFFLIAKFMERYKATIITFDIDMIAENSLLPIIEYSQKFDYCRYRRDGYGPGGHDRAAVTSFTGNKGKEMAKLVERIIVARFKESDKHSWFVDQTALFQAWHYLSRGDETSFKDASYGTELPELEHFFQLLDATEVKFNLSTID